jgi:hypothetical protein
VSKIRKKVYIVLKVNVIIYVSGTSIKCCYTLVYFKIKIIDFDIKAVKYGFNLKVTKNQYINAIPIIQVYA